MGNADLRDIATIEETSPDALSGQTFAVDAHHWLYSYMSGMAYWMDEDIYTTSDGTEVLNLVACLRGLPTLLEHDIEPVFVFDGTAHSRKADEQERRREKRREAEQQLEEAREAGDMVTVKRLKARTQKLTPTVQETTRELLELAGIPYIEAPSAGEAQCAKLVRDGHADAVLSEDYDSLLFGAPKTVRNFSGKGKPEVMHFEKTLSTHDFTHQQLVDLALLLGTDYNDGVYGIGKKTGLSGLKEHGDVETFLEAKGKDLEDLDVLRSLFLEPEVETIEVDSSVTTPDYDAIHDYVHGEWEVERDRVETELDRLRDAMSANPAAMN